MTCKTQADVQSVGKLHAASPAGLLAVGPLPSRKLALLVYGTDEKGRENVIVDIVVHGVKLPGLRGTKGGSSESVLMVQNVLTWACWSRESHITSRAKNSCSSWTCSPYLSPARALTQAWRRLWQQCL